MEAILLKIQNFLIQFMPCAKMANEERNAALDGFVKAFEDGINDG